MRPGKNLGLRSFDNILTQQDDIGIDPVFLVKYSLWEGQTYPKIAILVIDYLLLYRAKTKPALCGVVKNCEPSPATRFTTNGPNNLTGKLFTIL